MRIKCSSASTTSSGMLDATVQALGATQSGVGSPAPFLNLSNSNPPLSLTANFYSRLVLERFSGVPKMEAVPPDAWREIVRQLDSRSLCSLAAMSTTGRQASMNSSSLNVELVADRKLITRLLALLLFVEKRQNTQVTCQAVGSVNLVGAMRRPDW